MRISRIGEHRDKHNGYMIGLNEILGNELAKNMFRGAIAEGIVSHAYLLVGEKGLGKRTMADAVALELLCPNRRKLGHACMDCPSCKQVMSDNHPDFVRIRHAKPDSISVEEIRLQLNDTICVRPYSAPYKIYVMPDAQKMTAQAQNALLKTLEEPPEYAVILLLADDEKTLLPTIESRVMKVKLKPCTDGELRAFLTKRYPEAEDQIDLAVAFARGNPGKAIEILESETFASWYHLVIRICRSIKRMDGAQILEETKALLAGCPDMRDALELIQLWYRDLMMYKVTKDMNGLLFRGERSALMELASISSYEGIEEISDDIETCRRRLAANVNPELAVELLLLNMKEK